MVTSLSEHKRGKNVLELFVHGNSSPRPSDAAKMTEADTSVPMIEGLDFCYLNWAHMMTRHSKDLCTKNKPYCIHDCFRNRANEYSFILLYYQYTI